MNTETPLISNRIGLLLGLIGVSVGVLALHEAAEAHKRLAQYEAKLVVFEKKVAKAGDAADRADKDLRALQASAQKALNDAGAEIGRLRASVSKLEEAKAKP